MELELVKFIKEHENWEELLTSDPYNLTITRNSPYIMFKYSQIKSDFTIPLVREARGIILREDRLICVARAFDKFGNYGENYCPDIDWSTASVQEKIDGSLIKVWCDDGWHISTNNTIDAFNASLPNQMDKRYQNFGQLFLAALHKHICNEHFFLDNLDNRYTYIFELVSPFNRVVIPYNEIELYFIGWRDNVTGKELDVNSSYLSSVLPCARRFSFHCLEETQKAANNLPWDEEGYVVCDKNFNRVKIKSPKWVEAHYMRGNNVNTREHMIDIILKGEQAEFNLYAPEYAEQLHYIEDIMHKIAAQAVENLKEVWGAQSIFNNRAEYASVVKDSPFYIKDFLFHGYDERLFWDYAKNWTASKWQKAIEGYEVINRE